LLELIDSDDLMIHGSDGESQILLEAMSAHPEEVWSEIAERLEARDWRVQMEIRGWLLTAAPVEVLDRWINHDIDRARIVAAVAPVGGDSPTPVAQLLLERFPDDKEVWSGLWGDFMSGTWMGPESTRLETQIEQLTNWRTRGGEPEGVRRWAAEMIGYLEARRDKALQEEAEGRF
jgi:hypothetical protein